MPDGEQGEVDVAIGWALGHELVEVFHVSEEKGGGGLRDVGVLDVAVVVDAAVGEDKEGHEGGEEEEGGHRGGGCRWL